MPRTYKKAAGCRPYANYTEDMLENALKEIRDKRISIRAAANKYGIHRNTLMNKLHGKHTAQIGGQTVFSHEEEDMFWKWSKERDEIFYPYADILQKIKTPEIKSKRGLFYIPELQKVWDQ